MVSRSIGHLCHLLRFIYWVYLSLWVLVRFFIWVFIPWATLVMHLEYREFIWEVYEILCFLDHGWYVLGMRDEWPFTRVPDHFLTHHSIIGDMTFLYCTNMGWSSLIPLSHCFLLYPITSFQIFVPPFIHSLHIDTHY